MLNLVGQKVGMSHIFDNDGTLIPVTIIKVNQTSVVESNQDSVVLSCPIFTRKKSPSVVKKSFNAAELKHFLNDRAEDFTVGESLKITSFVKNGDLIDVSGITVGKGFAGVMKRHGFAGLEASHGVSVSHRSHGSTGQRQDPGKVFKGKKMAGRMGGDKVTVKNLKVVSFDDNESFIVVKGAVPGSAGKNLSIKVSKHV